MKVAPYCAHNTDSWVIRIYRWTSIALHERLRECIRTCRYEVLLVAIEVFLIECENPLALRLYLPGDPFLGGIATLRQDVPYNKPTTQMRALQ